MVPTTCSARVQCASRCRVTPNEMALSFCVLAALACCRSNDGRRDAVGARTEPERAAVGTEVDVRARIDAYLQPLVAMRMFAGSALVARSGEILLQQGYGLADIEAGVANVASTRFKLMSTSKSITAVALMQLVQAGKVS